MVPAETSDGPGVTIGIDVGGTKVHAVAFNRNFEQLDEVRVPTASDDGADVADLVLDTVETLDAKTGNNLIGIGVGIPGLVDRKDGSVRQAVNLGIGADPLDIVARLTGVHDVPCLVDNDVNVAALGAYRMLKAKLDTSDLAYLSIGTGIAAGVILDGRLHRGSRGVSGEIGHFPIAPGGPVCGCGLQGCLEAVASGSAISQRWPTAGDRSPTSSLMTEARRGNQQAIAVLGDVTDRLAKAVYLLAITYDVAYIVIGGGVADAGEPLLAALRGGLERLGNQSGFVRSLDLGERVILKPPGPVGALGAASLVNPELR